MACLQDLQDGQSDSLLSGGQPLAKVLGAGPLGTPELLRLGLHLAQTLCDIHRRGVVHQNISPEHIFVWPLQKRPRLIGFHLATTFAEEPGFTHHSEIRGNLTYLAPEQTGRTGRSVDQRADLYSLGATLYEAATGRPPFQSHDLLQLLYDHLARLPAAPTRLRADLPPALSQLILRLLEKEPERRYQSAEGLAHDLDRIQMALSSGDPSPQRLGEHDFAAQLAAPARLVGRSAEISALRAALDGAVQGRARMLLISGAPGVGKSSLINELRPMVTARRGWFAAGKFDQYREDAPTATRQAFRALGRLLLAEPEAELASQRERILRALGANAGLMCGMPEFALLLGPQPAVPAAEPGPAEARLLVTALNMLRVIVSPERPVVLVLDDLQWTGALSVRFIEAVLEAPDMSGLLLVGSYRDSDVDAAHPLTALLSRRSRQAEPLVHLRLANLPADDVGELLGEMMRLPGDRACALALAVNEHTGGNPFDTVELVNALRRDGTLRPAAGGWVWDDGALRRYVGQSGVLDLLAARIARLPPASQSLMHVMACMGGRVPLSLLSAASGLSSTELDVHLALPLEDGLLAIEPGADSVLRMRHDRVQQAMYGRLAPAQRAELHLGVARRLSGTPQFSGAAVQQYLPAVDAICEPDECRRVARLFHESTVRNRGGANYGTTQRLLAAALSLLDRLPSPGAQDGMLRAAVEIDQHEALCSLAWFEEADALYRIIEARSAPVEDRAGAACAQIASLTNRSRAPEALTLGLSLLRQLGLQVPDDFAGANLEQQMVRLGQWIKGVDVGHDWRPHDGDGRGAACARLIHRLSTPAYFTNPRIMAWLISQAQVLWVRHGPSPELAAALSHLGAVAITMNQDFRTAYDGCRHVLGVSEARGWEPSTSEARFFFAAHGSCWVEPLEETLRHYDLARDGMQRNGELHGICISYRPSTIAMLDCCPTLRECEVEIEAGLALAMRLRQEYMVVMMSTEQQLVHGLRGQAQTTERPGDDSQTLDLRQMNHSARLSVHFCHALLAAVFGDRQALARHTAQAMAAAPFVSSYRVAQARLLQALSLAGELATVPAATRQALLRELDTGCEWMTRRADDAPDNFLHLLGWMQAERAWAVGDFQAAAAAFDAALCQVERVTRPWHHAMLAERCGLFYLAHGASKCGQHFIAMSMRLYKAWGADAKARQLESIHGFLKAAQGSGPDATDADPGAVAVDAIDALAILRASQALSSETSLSRLKARVADVMGSLTGATAVRFALWDEDRKDWFLSGEQGAQPLRMDPRDADTQSLLPLSAFRYAERTREPLLVEDATIDDRFARDPYLAGLSHCSLLIVPVMNQGSLRAMLLLENRSRRGAFSTGRLDAVSLIAGQLAVSLENALLYDRLEQRVRDQTHELVAAARRSGMAQIATNVLHNVGNVLNSVNVSAHMLTSQVRQSRAARVADLAELVETNAGDLARFFATDPRGQMLPAYLRDLAGALATEREQLLGELERLGASVDHVKNVVAMQQSYAGAGGVLEQASISELLDDAIRIHEDSLVRDGVAVTRHYGLVETFALDKTRVMQILVNLIKNARQAMQDIPGERLLRVAARQHDGHAIVEVGDNGCGIAPDNLPRLFSHGFTTKDDGHGFGLHSCSVAALEMGGTLAAQSAGAGCGATFTLRLPLGGRSR